MKAGRIRRIVQSAGDVDTGSEQSKLLNPCLTDPRRHY